MNQTQSKAKHDGNAFPLSKTAGAAAPRTPLSAGLDDDAITATDAIIDELKALAKSMLDATNAARNRANTLESRRSYEALMSAIEGRGADTHPAKLALQAGGCGPKAKHRDPHTSAVDSSISLSNAPAGSPEDEEEELIDVPSSLSAKSISAAQNHKKNNNNNHNEKKTTNNNNNNNNHHIEAVASRAQGNKREGAYPSHTVDDEGEDAPLDDIEDEQPVAHHGSRKPRSNLTTPKEAADADGDDDDDVYDGVRTQVFFRSTDAAAYKEVASATWKPEKLLRASNGTSTACDSDSESDGAGSSSSSSLASDDDNNGAKGAHPTRDSKKKKGANTKVFRMPAFPYGGGIEESHMKDLARQFSECIRNHQDNDSAVPELIRKSTFDLRQYQEVSTTETARQKNFQPTSPYAFVVEVEQDVLFDAARAREERREEFRRLVKKGDAPVTMGTFNLRVIMDPIKTGFEDEKNYPIVQGAIVAGRYQIIQLIGKATFSRAVRCYDLHRPIYDDDDDDDAKPSEDYDKNRTPIGYSEVCLKIINNTKDFFDQSLDEIRLLTLVNTYRDPDEAHVVRLIDAFYYKEHTMLVTELLSDNLYEYGRYNREEEKDFYFTVPRMRRIARQIVEALAYVHSLNLIHADLKPENILFVSHRRCTLKVIDFGSSCFLSDHLSSYIQSRSYRAPEVIFGCDYDGRIDVWSLGGILVELITGEVLFSAETVPEMLARIVYVCGVPYPRSMLWEGRHTCGFINKFGCIYDSGQSSHAKDEDGSSSGEEPYYVYTPVPPEKKTDNAPYSVLRQKLEDAGMRDPEFLSFVEACLTLDHKKRPTSEELLSHPFIANEVL